MEISPAHMLLILAIGVAFVIPLYRLLPRAGLPAWLCVLGILPIFAAILLWFVAFRPWPGDEKASRKA